MQITGTSNFSRSVTTTIDASWSSSVSGQKLTMYGICRIHQFLVLIIFLTTLLAEKTTLKGTNQLKTDNVVCHVGCVLMTVECSQNFVPQYYVAFTLGFEIPEYKMELCVSQQYHEEKVIDWEEKITSIPGATLLVPLSSNIVRSWELYAQYGCTLRNPDMSGRTCTRLAICRAKRHVFRCEN